MNSLIYRISVALDEISLDKYTCLIVTLNETEKRVILINDPSYKKKPLCL
ncbi:MAG: hypothetical protein ACI89T_001079 [Cognaticolwellia sp.]|jgi:hypothetical protein